MSELNQGFNITIVGMVTIFGILLLVALTSEILKRVLSKQEPIPRQVETATFSSSNHKVTVVVDDKEYDVELKGNIVVVDGQSHRVSLKPEFFSEPSKTSEDFATISPSVVKELPVAHENGEDTTVLSPMNGKVMQLKVIEGDKVGEGEVLLTLEVMKMEIDIYANNLGRISKILVETGQTVELNQPLMVIGT